jgi:hypothetical protein
MNSLREQKAGKTNTKDYLILASHQKIALLRMKKLAFNTDTFFPHLHWFYLHSTMPEKSYGPWKETVYIPQCQKSHPVTGVRTLTFPHSGKVWYQEQD